MKKFEIPQIEIINLDEEVLTTTIGGQSQNCVDCAGVGSSCTSDGVIFG
ncbi:MAG: hypothetical protein ACOX8B_04700 [Lachnospiraceae bacterium]|jgi:hypothetical protein